MGTSLKNKYNFIGVILFVLLSIFFLYYQIRRMQNDILYYDEAYNATVVANFVRYGEWRTSYAKPIVFNNLITTGVPTLLPTALLYTLFGINGFTSAFIPLLYSILDVALAAYLVYSILRDFELGLFFTCVTMCAVLYLDSFFGYISGVLIGESAALFFMLAACLLLYRNSTKGGALNLLGCGACVATSFLTKTSMIFIVVALTGLALFETVILKRLRFTNLAMLVGGFILGFVIVEAFKLVQLGSLEALLAWWKREWANMLGQSGGVSLQYSYSQKLAYLGEDTFFCDPLAALGMCVLPSVYYLAKVVRSKHDGKTKTTALEILCIFALAASSLEIFFVLFGSDGLFYGRRHCVNVLFVRLFAVSLLVHSCLTLTQRLRADERLFNEESSHRILISLAILAFFLLCQPAPMFENMCRYVREYHTPTQSKTEMDAFLCAVDDLESEASLYAAGWWQEPNISLYLDRSLIDAFSVNAETFDMEHGYFVAGERVEGYTIEDLEGWFNADFIPVYSAFEDSMRYSIYRISSSK